METIADILLIAGAFSAGLYCLVLSKKLKKLKSSESGIGSAVVELSDQVDDLTKSVSLARNSAAMSMNSLSELTNRAEQVAHRLELLVASMHDIPEDVASKADHKDVATPVFASRMKKSVNQ